jgi:hypothetical protein
MKKSSLWAFALGFLIPFSFTTIALYITTARFRLLDGATLFQCLLIIGVVSLLIAAFTAFSSFIQAPSEEQEDFSGEIAEGASLFFRAMPLLRLRPFFPFWLAFAALLAGSILIARDYPLSGSFLLLTGQAFWLLTRDRLRAFIDQAPMDNRLYPYLLWVMRGMDAFALVAVAEVMGSLGTYGEITDNITLLTFSALVAFAFVVYRAWRAKESLDADHALKWSAAFIWTALVGAAFNFGFDFKSPLSVRTLVYSECIEYRDLVLSGKAKPSEKNLECHYFSRVKDAKLESTIEITDHAGAFGIGWKKGRFIR